ncbi:12320_t:CDS:2, partial [Funneliformis caledonium]
RATKITISLFKNEHNHELKPETSEFSNKYRGLTKEMMDEIKIMTKHSNLSITNDLLEKFPLAKDYLLRSTSRVEEMNGIIKRTIRSNSTLCQLVECLAEWLITEIQWGRFHEYRSSTTSSISVSMGEDLFPSIVETLK